MNLPKAAGRLGLAKRGGSARRGTPKKVPPNIETRLFSLEFRDSTSNHPRRQRRRSPGFDSIPSQWCVIRIPLLSTGSENTARLGGFFSAYTALLCVCVCRRDKMLIDLCGYIEAQQSNPQPAWVTLENIFYIFLRKRIDRLIGIFWYIQTSARTGRPVSACTSTRYDNRNSTLPPGWTDREFIRVNAIGFRFCFGREKEASC